MGGGDSVPFLSPATGGAACSAGKRRAASIGMTSVTGMAARVKGSGRGMGGAKGDNGYGRGEGG